MGAALVTHGELLEIVLLLLYARKGGKQGRGEERRKETRKGENGEGEERRREERRGTGGGIHLNERGRGEASALAANPLQ